MVRPSLARTLPALLLFAAAAGCDVYPDSLLDAPGGSMLVTSKDAGAAGTGGASGADAAVEAGYGLGFWSTTLSDGCFSAGLPTIADKPDAAAATELPPIYLGIYSLGLGDEDPDGTSDMDAWQNYGFDLDGVCTNSNTCSDQAVSCKSPTSMLPFDGNDCRDNTFGRLEYFVASQPAVGAKYMLSDQSFNCALCTGLFNIIVKISNYNGQPDDDQVRVDLYDSPGLVTPLDAVSCTSAVQASNLCWLENAQWQIDEGAFADSTMQMVGSDLGPSSISDPNAFVRDGYLVMQLPSPSLLRFPSVPGKVNSFPLNVSLGLVTGRIAQAMDGTWQLLDGTIGGRVTYNDIITGFREIGLCESDPTYSLVMTYLNAYLDIRADGVVDPTMPCDSISMGLIFTANQASIGPIVSVPPLVDCPPLPDGGAGAAGEGGSGGAASGSGGAGD